MDKDNFEFKLDQWHVVMCNGQLVINDYVIDPNDQDQDPTYAFVIEIAKAKGLIKC